jgi:transcriptional antiterminator RfaH
MFLALCSPSFEVGNRRSFMTIWENQAAWFCLRTQLKHEHIAAAHLRQMEDVEFFFPRMAVRRKSRQGVREVIEPLFPNYLFARFAPNLSLARARHTAGVQTIVHFGNRVPVIPDAAIEELRRQLNSEEICRLAPRFAPGDTVAIGSGAFSGLQAVVKRYLPGKRRVMLLLDFLGRQVNIEIAETEVVKEKDHPLIKQPD